MIPISGTKFSPFLMFKKGGNFELELANMLGWKRCFTLGRGAEAIYILLGVLKKATEKDKVIIPAYTADTVFVPTRQVGCKVTFCNMSLKTFNMDMNHLKFLANDKTLAIIAVHLFGIPENMEEIKAIAKEKNIFIIDDFCQAFGSKYKDKCVGSFGDASVLSFGKGKNFTTLNGGALFLNDSNLIYKIENVVKDLEPVSRSKNLKISLKATALSILASPFFYGIFYKLLSQFREIPAPEKIELKRISKLQKNLGINLLEKANKFLEPRYYWGAKLYDLLKDNTGVIVPQINKDQYIIWNRFPVLVKNLEKKANLRNKLLKSGIESNYLYSKPVFEHFGIEVERGTYKNSIYMAEHLITLPTNCFMNEKAFEIIEKCFKEEI